MKLYQSNIVVGGNGEIAAINSGSIEFLDEGKETKVIVGLYRIGEDSNSIEELAIQAVNNCLFTLAAAQSSKTGEKIEELVNRLYLLFK